MSATAGKKRPRSDGAGMPPVESSAAYAAGSGVSGSGASVKLSEGDYREIREPILRALASKKKGMTDDELMRSAGVYFDAFHRRRLRIACHAVSCTAGLEDQELLVQALNRLLTERRVEIYTHTAEGGSASVLVYKYVSEEVASKLVDLTQEEQQVLAIVEKSGNVGVWVRNVKLQARLQTMQLNKILKRLESRKLIKAIKSVQHRNRRMYMAYALEPAKEVTGGPWYSDQQLDETLINGVRNAIMDIMRANAGPMTPRDVTARLAARGVSAVPLKAADVVQLMDTLVYDGLLDRERAGTQRVKRLMEPLRARYIPPERARGVPTMLGARRVGAAGSDGGSALAAIMYDDAAAAAAAAAAAVAEGSDDEDMGQGDVEEEEDDDEGGDEVELTLYHVVTRPTHFDGFTSSPCGVCPVFHQCTPGGLVSPETCVYYTQWLDF